MNNLYDWQTKFASGEYLHEWNGYSPYFIGCMAAPMYGGEEKFLHCCGFFSGIGDVEWWIKAELDKLSTEEQSELLNILKRNKNKSYK